MKDLRYFGAILALSVATEGLETAAGHFGVTSRGGSKAAGLAAVGGGFFGLLLGTFIPIPVAGSLLGMCAGSFVCAYLVERRRQGTHKGAAHVARGVLVARIAVIGFKVSSACVTTCVLLWGFYRGWGASGT